MKISIFEKARKIKLAIWLTVGFILFAAGCSSLKVNHDYDKEEDFSKFRTYDFFLTPEGIRSNELVMKRIYESLAIEMKAKGYTREGNTADVLIAVHTDVRDRVDIVSYGYHYAPQYRNGYWGPDRISTYRYEKGSLVIDIVKAENMELIWRGVAQAALPSNPSPERVALGVKNAVKAILDTYPPKK